MVSGIEKHLEIIDFHLAFFGCVKRIDLMAYGEISIATASRALSEYRERAPGSIDYSAKMKAYIVKKDFIPMFSHDAEHALKYLAYRKVERFVSESSDIGLARLPSLSATLPEGNVRKITTALTLSQPISLNYYSASSDLYERVVQPLAVFESAGAWYFRLYDFDALDFRTFRFSRVLSVKPTDAYHNKIPVDTEWEERVIITLMPHPKHPTPGALKLDLGLTDKTVCNLSVRKALAGYLLNALNVDASSTAALSPIEHQLYLANRHELSNISSMTIAPGFYAHEECYPLSKDE